MKLIIDVPEEVYEALKGIAEDATSLDPYSLADIIVNKSEQIDLWKMRQEATENALKKAEVLFKRPQGEWIIVKDERHGDNVKCPFCGKELAGTDLNYCCKCGADMMKGDET